MYQVIYFCLFAYSFSFPQKISAHPTKLQGQRWANATGTLWPAKSKTFTIWPFSEKVSTPTTIRSLNPRKFPYIICLKVPFPHLFVLCSLKIPIMWMVCHLIWSSFIFFPSYTISFSAILRTISSILFFKLPIIKINAVSKKFSIPYTLILLKICVCIYVAYRYKYLYMHLYTDTHIQIYTHIDIEYIDTHTDIFFLYQVLVSVYGIFKLCHAGSSSLIQGSNPLPTCHIRKAISLESQGSLK